MSAKEWIALLGIGVSVLVAWLSRRQSAAAKLQATNAELRADEALKLAKDHDERDRQRLDRERTEDHRKREELRIRLWMFAHEAVELQRRWAQYMEQAVIEQVSFSLPFEWTTDRTVSEFLSLGGDQRVVQSIYRVKQLNFQVSRSLRDQQEAINARQPVALRAPAFLVAENEQDVSDHIGVLLNAAEQTGNNVADLRETFAENLATMKTAMQQLKGQPSGADT